MRKKRGVGGGWREATGEREIKWGVGEEYVQVRGGEGQRYGGRKREGG